MRNGACCSVQQHFGDETGTVGVVEVASPRSDEVPASTVIGDEGVADEPDRRLGARLAQLDACSGEVVGQHVATERRQVDRPSAEPPDVRFEFVATDPLLRPLDGARPGERVEEVASPVLDPHVELAAARERVGADLLAADVDPPVDEVVDELGAAGGQQRRQPVDVGGVERRVTKVEERFATRHRDPHRSELDQRAEGDSGLHDGRFVVPGRSSGESVADLLDRPALDGDGQRQCAPRLRIGPQRRVGVGLIGVGDVRQAKDLGNDVSVVEAQTMGGRQRFPVRPEVVAQP